ncbi:hypothetical protein WA026_012069 [Henosepilachna vigintioctopunctata]|uniref:Eukaryotic translation initiation factor 3 subunit A n=1 Tax=Henosepilachna vigintioctopunctata TaxID=420089 RepID=A0AAW1VCH3_9CUCU
MERLLVDCVRYNDMQVRIDHGKNCVHFGIDLSESQREDKPEGPTLQVMPSEQIRNQLVNMSIVLHKAIGVINPQRKKNERDRIRTVMVQNYHDNKAREHQKILQRHKIIEDRKEYIERLNTVREVEEQRRLEEIQKQYVIAEQKRLELEREERERKRALNEIQQIKDRHLKEKLQQISQTGHGQKMLKKLDEDDIKKLDADQIAAKEEEELKKERRELQAKLKSQEKKVDYFERAKRLEEIPLLQASIKEKQLLDQNFWEQLEKERIAAAIEERKLAVATRDRLLRMKPDKDVFLAKLKKERNIVYEDKLKEFEEMLTEERKKRLLKRKVERKEERRIQWLKEKENYEQKKREEQRRREEELQLEREEIARKEREEREKKEREEKEKKAIEHREMLERTAAKQRLRDEEIERKLRVEREQLADQVKGKDSWRTKALKDRDGDRGLTRERDTEKRGPFERDSDKRQPALERERDRERRPPTSDRDSEKTKPATESETTDGVWRRAESKPAAPPAEEGKKSEVYRPKFRTEENRSSDPAPNAWRSIRTEEKKDDDRDRREDNREHREYQPITRGEGGFNRDRREGFMRKDDRDRDYNRGRGKDEDRDREDRPPRRDFRGGEFRRNEDKEEGRSSGAWRTAAGDKRQDGDYRSMSKYDNDENRNSKREDRERDETPREMGNWRTNRKPDDEQPSSVYRPPRGVSNRDRDGTRDREGFRDRDGQRERGGFRDRDGQRERDGFRDRDSQKERDGLRDRDGPRREMNNGTQLGVEKEDTFDQPAWKTVQKVKSDQPKTGGNGGDKLTTSSKEKVQEQPEQHEADEGWSTVSKRR